MGVTVGGVSLDSLVWNVRTRGDRMVTAGRRVKNIARAGLDGLAFSLRMWILGADPLGEFPSDPVMRSRVERRYEKLLRVMAQQDELVEVVDTRSQRRCFAEIGDNIGPTIQAGGSRAEVEFPLVVPAGCWEDVTPFDTGTGVVLPANGSITVTGGGGGTLPLQGLTITLTPPASNVVITTADGRWVQFAGPIPAGAATVLDLNVADPYAYQLGAPATSLLSKVTWDTVAPLPIRASASGADPVLTVTAGATTAASRIRIQGRRRYLTA
jgi:hypothetical protein